MKRCVMLGLVLVIVLIGAGSAGAWHFPRYHFRLFVAPPAIYLPPPPFWGSDPGYLYYGPDYRGPRVWVPGHWEERWTRYGWERVWVPGHWRWD